MKVNRLRQSSVYSKKKNSKLTDLSEVHKWINCDLEIQFGPGQQIIMKEIYISCKRQIENDTKMKKEMMPNYFKHSNLKLRM